MFGIFDKIEEFFKELLLGGIQANLESMFLDINDKVGAVATDVGKTPMGWNGDVFAFIKSINDSVIIPIAGLIITAVLCIELINMVMQKNNMHDTDTFEFFKYIIKMWIAVWLVSHAFEFSMAVFDVAQHVEDGTKYKDFYYYGCKHRLMNRGHKCTYNKQIREELLDDAVAEVIIKLVSNPKFASMIQEKIKMKVDTSAIENEIDNYQKELRKSHSTKFKLIEEIDNLDVEDKHYKRRKNDLDDRLYRMYDKIEDLESQLIEAKAKKETIEAEKLTGDNIYKVLIYFDKLYKVMNDVERRQLIEALISEVQIYEEKQANGQWLKSVTFKLPIIDENLNISLDNDEQIEAVALLKRREDDQGPDN